MASEACEASIQSLHSILSSISNHASELAVNAINNLIEDQVADPKKFEKNLSRVKSVFSGCNEHVVRGGDCSEYERKFLLTLPRKIRQNIWTYLDDKTVKTLRLVCEQLRHEMDYDVGLTVVLHSDSFSNMWMRSLTIRSCYVKKMTSLFTLNNFCRPEKLQRLCFDPEVQVDPDMTELIMRKFRNIQQIIIYTEDVTELKNFLEEVTPNNNSSSKIISRLEDQFRLTSIDVKFDTSKWKLKWNIKLKPQNYEKYWQVEDVVGPFGICGISPVPVSRDLSRKTLKNVTISIPFVQDRDRCAWLKVLQSQNVLVSLTCDLNATHWKDYEKIVRASHRTLEKLFLLNITCSEKRFSVLATVDEPDAPFDWKMFEQCKVLKEITLIAETFLHSSVTKFSPSQEELNCKPRRYINSVNLNSLSCPLLRAVWLENFRFTEDEMDFLKHSAPEKPRFELCTLKNCKLGQEEVSEAHLGVKKERNRSLECLCFGTLVYDDDDLDNFEKYTANKLAEEESLAKRRDFRFPLDVDLDMIECFQLASRTDQQEEKKDFGTLISDNMNLIGGIAFTAWLYFI